jgi:SAM-dependent methyltransferase
VDPETDVCIWHRGLIAQWWAEFLQGGSEVDYLRRWIDRYGQPVLDAGCGTGRLLIPYLRAGLDVDGSDASGDMLAHCAELARREGLEPKLFEQPLHALDLPRRYRSICVCGVFGLGVSRARDREALRRLLEHLEPGGALLLNHYVSWLDARLWQYWQPEQRARLPEPMPEPGEARVTSDGSALRLRSRVLEFDPTGPSVVRELLTESLRNGAVEREERAQVRENLYFPNEIALLLESTGFRNVVVHTDHPASGFAPAGNVFTIIGER